MSPKSGHAQQSLAHAVRALQVHGVAGVLRLARAVIYTKLFEPQARLIRLPVYIRNRRLIRFGKRFTSGVGLRIEAFSDADVGCLIDIGDNVQVNDYVHIAAAQKVTIGNNVLIASKVFISDHNHGNYGDRGSQDSPEIPPTARPIVSAPVAIGDNVWIGEFVSILPGVSIGRGAVVGTMSVVTKDIPPYSVAVGAPARVIKSYNFSSGRWDVRSK